MNTDQLQQWARDVGATARRNRHYPGTNYTFSVGRLAAFAEMVRKAQCVDADQMRSYAAEAVAAERERCAKVCEEIAEAYRGTRWGIYGEVIGGRCAENIRKGSS